MSARDRGPEVNRRRRALRDRAAGRAGDGLVVRHVALRRPIEPRGIGAVRWARARARTRRAGRPMSVRARARNSSCESFLRATPSRTVASATAAAISGNTSDSSIVGRMWWALKAPALGARARAPGRDDHDVVRNRAGSGVQDTAEDRGEDERVVHLVRKVAPSGRDDRGAARSGHVRPDLRHRVRKGEDDRLARHRAHVLGTNGPRDGRGRGDQHVGPFHGAGEVARPTASVRLEREPVLPRVPDQQLVDVVALGVEDPLLVDQCEAVRVLAERETGDARRPGSPPRHREGRSLPPRRMRCVSMSAFSKPATVAAAVPS